MTIVKSAFIFGKKRVQITRLAAPFEQMGC